MPKKMLAHSGFDRLQIYPTHRAKSTEQFRALHPDLRFSRSLHHGKARLGHESKVHNSEGPYSHSNFRFSSFFWGPLPPENRTFPSPKFIHKDLR